jgi:hypothetical protein
MVNGRVDDEEFYLLSVVSLEEAKGAVGLNPQFSF